MVTPLQPQRRGVDPGTPEVQHTPVPVAESTRQNPRTPGSEMLRVDQEGLSFAGIAEVTQIRRPRTEVVGTKTEDPPSQGEGREGRSPVPANPNGDEGQREWQIVLL